MNIKTLLGNENEILLAGVAPHAMVLGNLSSLRLVFMLALTVRFHLTSKSCACACVASENQALPESFIYELFLQK